MSSLVEDYIELADFTSGIYTAYFSSAAAPAPDGAAQDVDTWGCFGHPAGGLHPLGKAATTLTDTVWTDLAWSAGYYPPERIQVNMGDGFCPGANISTQGGYGDSGDALFVPYRRVRDLDGVGDSYEAQFKYRLYKYYGASVPDTFDYHDSVSTGFHAQYVATGGNVSGFAAPHTITRTVPSGGTPTDPGEVVVAYHVPNNLLTNGLKFGMYPSPAAPTLDGVLEETVTEIPFLSLGHQGRYVSVLNAPGNFGVSDQGIAGIARGERVQWKPVNNATAAWTNPNGTVFVEEDPSGIGVVASMNANELLLVKNGQGGIIVRGDLDDPEVIWMPGIRGCSSISVPAVTPKGLLYPAGESIELWDGGEASRSITDQLEGTTFGLRQRVAYVHPFVAFDAGRIWDIRTEAWWLLEDPDAVTNEYRFFSRSSDSHDLWAVNSVLDADNPSTVAVKYSLDQGRNDFSWRSQPLQAARGRYLTYREIELVAQGDGTVTVQVVGIDGASATASFTFDSTARPLLMRKSISVETWDAQIVITSTGNEASDAAPTVYRARAGYREGRRAANG